MARVLIVGCGCRGQALARGLRDRGHAVRGTTRSEARRPEIEAAGAEVWVGDPDRIATIHYALADVTILCWLLGSASGSREQLEALHGSRLRMLLERTIDTTVRGLVYEAAGSVDAGLLAAGAQTVRAACGKSEIPHALLTAAPADHGAWLAAALAAVEELLAFERG
ncbi:MAG TPA: NAD(P)H-binding protein [Conexibacter sp.]|nr:NAD(P)H-binding protein [Conexibacter sp.]